MERGLLAIGGIRGGSGKTIVTLGIIRALQRRGLKVASFKKGPDYIDPAWMSLAAGSTCYNLDSFLMNDECLRETLLSRGAECDIAVLEGNRGIFDGFDVDGSHSLAEIVVRFNMPVILVVDCAKSSRSIAAVVYGCQKFDRRLRIGGVILNRIAGERHRRLISSAVEKYCNIPVLGAIPRITHLKLSERHLGLVPVYEHENPGAMIDEFGDVVEKNADIDAIVRLSHSMHRPSIKSFIGGRRGVSCNPASIRVAKAQVGRGRREDAAEVTDSAREKKPVIGIFSDAAFNFYYRENFEALQRHGAGIVLIDSMSVAPLPRINALYIGGGFPETHARQLSANVNCMNAIRSFIESGMPVYAECGGLIYLSRTIRVNNESYPMVGIFPLAFELSKSPEGHGYTIFTVDGENPYFTKGCEVRGHEFRYSRIVNTDEAASLPMVFTMQRGRGIINMRDGLIYKNTLATFSHTHALSRNVSWMQSMVALARRYADTPA